MSPLTQVPLALHVYETAEQRLVAAIENAYPIGAIVSATLGRARVTGPVVGHGGAGYHRGYVGIENERTGKERWFYVADRSVHDVAIESTEAELRQLRARHGMVLDR